MRGGNIDAERVIYIIDMKHNRNNDNMVFDVSRIKQRQQAIIPKRALNPNTVFPDAFGIGLDPDPMDGLLCITESYDLALL